ncbi:MAG: S8 family serine peptidase [Candidatus Brocadiia bacterium]
MRFHARLVAALAVAALAAPLGAAPYTVPLDAEVTGTADLVSGSPAGHWSTPPAPASTVHINNFLGANRFTGAGYNGAASVLANAEAGHIWAGHETLGHLAVTQNLNPADPQAGPQTGEVDRHATWVGMHLGGRNGGRVQGNWQTGIAPGATLWSGAIATSWVAPAYSGTFQANTTTFLDPYVAFFQGGVGGQTADAVNSSWGFDDSGRVVEAGGHSWQMATDALSNSNPLTTFVASAGNEGDPPNTVHGCAAGYNVIAVAALTSDTSAPPYDFVAPFSSRSPNDYWDPVNGFVYEVRAAVDIAAPGTDLTAAYYGGATGGNSPLIGGPAGPAGGANWYTGQLRGTSFSAPIVAGGVALVDDAARAVFPANANARDARVVKAVLQNAAAKDAFWDNGQQVLPGGIIATSQSLDWETGAGRMDLDRTFDQYLPPASGGAAGTTDVPGLFGGGSANVEPVGWDYAMVGGGAAGPNDYYITKPLLDDTDFRASLTWFRDRILDVDQQQATDVSMDDLNLEIWSVLGGAPANLVATSNSVYNNVEHLAFDLPATGDYMVRVVWAGEVFDELGDAQQEYYGLAWWGTQVPEPATAAVLGLGLAALARRRRRRR